MSSLSTSLKNSYQRWLYPYEEYLRLAKPGVHLQLEHENGGPLTPSPADSPLKRSQVNTPGSGHDPTLAAVASAALNASIGEGSEVDEPRPSSLGPTNPLLPSAFTTNHHGESTSMHASNGSRRAMDDEQTPSQPTGESRPTSSHDSPEHDIWDPTSSANGVSSHRKRRRPSHDAPDDSAAGDPPAETNGIEAGGRRSKRLKKGASIQ